MTNTSENQDIFPCYCANIRWVSREISRFYMRQLSKAGLPTPSFYTVLSMLQVFGSMSMADLSQIVHLERTTLVRKIKLMQKEELLIFENSEKSGVKLVQLTDKGRDVLKVADMHWNKAQELFRSTFDDSELVVLDSILKKLANINKSVNV